MATEELEACELGTQEYWDSRYKMEIKNFKSHGDIGEIWFGEDIIDRIIRWMEKSPLVEKHFNIVDLGCGNGMLLVELARCGYNNLLGVDYSKDAVDLASAICADQKLNIKYSVNDILKNELEVSNFDIALDKGTYDAVSLSENPKENRNVYIENVHSCLKENGLLVITSCNWTQDELVEQFQNKFDYFESIPTPQFKFGGKVGNVVTSIILKKK